MPDNLDALLSADQVDAAISTCQDRLRDDPSNAELHACLGVLLLRKKSIDAAAAEFRKAMLLDEHLWADGFEFMRKLGTLVSAELKTFDRHRAANAQRFSGPPYLEVLRTIHAAVKPKTYVEIGVHTGQSLSLAPEDAVAIGIDPAPVVQEKLTAKTRVFELTSDDFFAQQDLAKEIGAPSFDLAFIDGLHLWEQALKDFINCEKFARHDSVIVLHDCMPLDDITSQRVRDSLFYTGDVWKLAACLRQERPDLKMAMVPTAPSGLCLVTGLNSSDRNLNDKYDALKAHWTPLAFADLQSHPEWFPETIPNSQDTVTSWLNGR